MLLQVKGTRLVIKIEKKLPKFGVDPKICYVYQGTVAHNAADFQKI